MGLWDVVKVNFISMFLNVLTGVEEWYILRDFMLMR